MLSKRLGLSFATKDKELERALNEIQTNLVHERNDKKRQITLIGIAEVSTFNYELNRFRNIYCDSMGLDSIRDVYDFYSSTINLLAFDFPLSKTVGSVRLIRENISLFHIAEVEAYLKDKNIHKDDIVQVDWLCVDYEHRQYKLSVSFYKLIKRYLGLWNKSHVIMYCDEEKMPYFMKWTGFKFLTFSTRKSKKHKEYTIGVFLFTFEDVDVEWVED